MRAACARDNGPDPYNTFKQTAWTISNTGCGRAHRHLYSNPPRPILTRLPTFSHVHCERMCRYMGGMGTKSKQQPHWMTHSLSRRQKPL